MSASTRLVGDGSASLRVRAGRCVHAHLSLDITLDLPASRRGVVYGPSGSGKTSLLRMIAGLDRPDVGTITLGEVVLDDAGARHHVRMPRRSIGYIHQHDCLFPHLDVAQNIGFGLQGWRRPERQRRLAEVADLAGVGRFLNRTIETLSGGERQRVGLARALAPRPQLLLCDEPVSALDLEARFVLIERLRVAVEAERVPLLYVTHSPAEAIVLDAHVFLLREGRIAADGPAIDILAAASAQTPHSLEGLRNVFAGRMVGQGQDSEGGATLVELDGGPRLVVPESGEAPGQAVQVSIRADDILLATRPPVGLSARNTVAGQVDRIIWHGRDAEVLVRTGAITWMVSLVAPSIDELALAPGGLVWLVIKARSCRLTSLDPGLPSGSSGALSLPAGDERSHLAREL